MSGIYYGCDIGGTTVKLARFDEQINIEKKWSIPTRREEDGVHILEDAAKSVAEDLDGLARANGVPLLLGVGIGVPGPVDPSGNISGAVNLGWKKVHVPDTFRRHLQEALRTYPGLEEAVAEEPAIVSGNDANMAALGEYYMGGGMGSRSMVLFTLGTGVGSGVVLDGTVLSGTFGCGGEVGHMKLNPSEEEACGCGGKGCLEQYASATGLVRIYQRYRKDQGQEMAPRSVTAKDIMELAKEGDAAACHSVDVMCDYLGRACCAVSCLVDPEVYVFGGGVSNAGDFLLDKIRKSFRMYAFATSVQAEFRRAVLGNDAGIYGCGLLAQKEHGR